MIFHGYVTDAAEAGRETGIKKFVISGGYIQQKPLEQWCRTVDAVN